MIKKKITDFCLTLGLDTIGYTKCRHFEELRSFHEARKEKGFFNEFEEQDIEKKINPFKYMESGKTIISIAFPYLFYNNCGEEFSFSLYTQSRDYHQVVKLYLEKICDFIKELGGEAKHFVDSNALPERYIAALSGVGFIGKNNMLITEKYGSYVFLGEIITDLEIEEDSIKESKCGQCDLCLKACPTGAIKGSKNPNICLSYITQKKEIEDGWFEKLQGRIFGCDTCQRSCPYNRAVQITGLLEFKPYTYMKNVNIEELLSLNKTLFNEKYIVTSCGWRGKNVLQRNALINYMAIIKKKPSIIINSPYIKCYYDRLLRHFKL